MAPALVAIRYYSLGLSAISISWMAKWCYYWWPWSWSLRNAMEVTCSEPVKMFQNMKGCLAHKRLDWGFFCIFYTEFVYLEAYCQTKRKKKKEKIYWTLSLSLCLFNISALYVCLMRIVAGWWQLNVEYHYPEDPKYFDIGNWNLWIHLLSCSLTGFVHVLSHLTSNDANPILPVKTLWFSIIW